MDEVLLRGCTLKNSGFVVGLVVYTGPESRIQMNAAAPPRKLGAFVGVEVTRWFLQHMRQRRPQGGAAMLLEIVAEGAVAMSARCTAGWDTLGCPSWRHTDGLARQLGFLNHGILQPGVCSAGRLQYEMHSTRTSITERCNASACRLVHALPQHPGRCRHPAAAPAVLLLRCGRARVARAFW